MKMTVVYHSESGNTQKMAECIARGMMKVEGVEARAFSIDAVDTDYAVESQAIVLGAPVYAAGMSSEMKVFLDKKLGSLRVVGKLVGAFATARFIHGGGDLTIQALLTHLMVLGGMAYSGGGALGQPVIHLGPVAIGQESENFVELFELYGERMATQAVKLFA